MHRQPKSERAYLRFYSLTLAWQAAFYRYCFAPHCTKVTCMSHGWIFQIWMLIVRTSASFKRALLLTNFMPSFSKEEMPWRCQTTPGFQFIRLRVLKKSHVNVFSDAENSHQFQFTVSYQVLFPVLHLSNKQLFKGRTHIHRVCNNGLHLTTASTKRIDREIWKLKNCSTQHHVSVTEAGFIWKSVTQQRHYYWR